MERNKSAAAIFAVVVVCLALVSASIAPAAANPLRQAGESRDWPYYGNDLGNMRYVDLDQINPGNVAQLAPAWIFHTGVFGPATSFESQPIIVGGTMYVSSPHAHVYALDAATGETVWELGLGGVGSSDTEMAIDPDGGQVVVSTGSGLRLWTMSG